MIENFVYDIPNFLQESFKVNGPPNILWDISPTAPDNLVPIYVDSWWDSEDLQGYQGKMRDFEELQSFGLHFHMDMASERPLCCQICLTYLRLQNITTQGRIPNFRRRQWNLVV